MVWLSFEVNRRTGEIGIGMAIGAGKGEILAWCCGKSRRWPMGSWWRSGNAVVARTAEGVVFDIQAGDPRVELAAASILAVVVVSAAWLPARRADCDEPMSALRNECASPNTVHLRCTSVGQTIVFSRARQPVRSGRPRMRWSAPQGEQY